MKFVCIVEVILAKCRAKVCCRCAAWALCVSTACCASAIQANGAPPKASNARIPPALGDTAVASTRRANPLGTETQLPESPSNADARPATVILKNGSLTVEANNSDLSHILKDIAAASGMTIDGSIRSVRVYGVYGPSNPRDVLTDLLTGLGYNFMMVGSTHEGAPRELQLTLRSGDSAPVPSPGQTAAAFDHRENTDVIPPDLDQPGPGAIVHVPPAAPQDPQQRVQQNLQRLQQMHDQQKPQNPPQ